MTARKKTAADLALAYLGAADVTKVRLDVVIREHVDGVLEATERNVSLAAELLGMHRRSLQRYLKRQKRPPRRRKS